MNKGNTNSASLAWGRDAIADISPFGFDSALQIYKTYSFKQIFHTINYGYTRICKNISGAY